MFIDRVFTMWFLFFFFFKQKTAYEMRISDWSSDVCSSDLLSRPHSRPPEGVIVEERPHWVVKATVQKTAWPVCDGLWFDANLLRAENGYGEIRKKLEELAAGDVVKYREWEDRKSIV